MTKKITKQTKKATKLVTISIQLFITAVLGLSSLSLAGWLMIDEASEQKLGFILGAMLLVFIAHYMYNADKEQ